MRLQNEILGERFNRFSDMVDLDRLAAQEYTPEVIIAISESLSTLSEQTRIAPLDHEKAEAVLRRAHTGAIGIPRLIQLAMQEVDTNV